MPCMVLEKKSISITRLKLRTCQRWVARWMVPWKEKHLDYEIETVSRHVGHHRTSHLKRKASRLRDWNLSMNQLQPIDNNQLEKKSISITRLKHGNLWDRRNAAFYLKRKASRLRDWSSSYFQPSNPIFKSNIKDDGRAQNNANPINH